MEAGQLGQWTHQWAAQWTRGTACECLLRSLAQWENRRFGERRGMGGFQQRLPFAQWGGAGKQTVLLVRLGVGAGQPRQAAVLLADLLLHMNQKHFLGPGWPLHQSLATLGVG